MARRGSPPLPKSGLRSGRKVLKPRPSAPPGSRPALSTSPVGATLDRPSRMAHCQFAQDDTGAPDSRLGNERLHVLIYMSTPGAPNKISGDSQLSCTLLSGCDPTV